MKRKFQREGGDGTPTISTAALPDIVFMLLFFFLIASAIKPSEYDKYVKLEPAKASELTDIVKKDMIAYLYIGIPRDKNKYPQDYMLLLNDKPAQVSDIRGWIGDEAGKKSGQDLMDYGLTTQMTIDKTAKVGFVQAIKEQLSYAQQFNVSYAGIEGDPTVE